MAERSRLFDDIAGMAGGAFSTLAGIGDEVGAIVRARLDEALSRLQLVRREEFEAVSELAANARDEAERAAERIAALDARVAALEARSSGHAVGGSATGESAPGGSAPGGAATGTRTAETDIPHPHEQEHPTGGAVGGPPPLRHGRVDGASNRADEIPTTD
ncbi:MAG: accessory factor UbiK family protein [Gluconacetobacter diazotrophicus]|nr:accessory factor UbiK family protein [Gluconacetobacter diazotrophicus]